ncbi:hypothetical protein CAPTEDRAFT_197255 [Capitella teleta]|uniref:Kringle domain-containing protein n=1 Tax=Capitella teleta TaxID=283909 RepID=R7VCS2_CAPTE|nr:hypothetical protein CAPTEDRAFT_197255 [Capitella teleta]|eukprot:ELU14101.1 hypothetical protein CAPTEDRAFT_197255 [Capitella teleta]
MAWLLVVYSRDELCQVLQHGQKAALPRTAYGCPVAEGFSWLEGSVDFLPELSLTWSPGFDLSGPMEAKRWSLKFCSKIRGMLAETEEDWPRGQYCIFRLHQEPCPDGSILQYISICLLPPTSSKMRVPNTTRFNSGDPQLNISTEVRRYVPLTQNGSDVRVRFCCREDAAEDAMQLVATTPFSLIRMSVDCPRLANMELYEEWITLPGIKPGITSGSTPDFSSNSSTTLNFYSYKPLDVCYHGIDGGSDYQGSVNFTSAGDCEPWINVTEYIQFTHLSVAVLLADSHCSRAFDLFQKPFCYVGEFSYECDIPECGKNTSSEIFNPTVNVIGTYPIGNRVRRGLPTRGSDTIFTQADILTDNEPDCAMYLALISLSNKPDGFLTRGVDYCQLNVTASSFETYIQCLRPVTGRYLTIQQIEHWECNTSKALNSRYYLGMCEVSIFQIDTCDKSSQVCYEKEKKQQLKMKCENVNEM